jgi:muconolactone delta-isomerase
MDFLVRTEFLRPTAMGSRELDQLRRREAAQAHALQQAGTIRQLWREEGTTVAWGIWEAPSEDAVRASVNSLPLSQWMSIDVHHVINHPNALIRQHSPGRPQ